MIAPKLRFSEFKDEWIELSLKEYYSKIRNGFVGVATPFYVENGIKYLQGKNIKDGKIDPKGLIYISEDFHHKKNNSQLKQNDILMVQSGHVGECAVVTQDYENANCHALIILSPDHNEKVNSHFVVYYFYSHYGKKRISEIKTGNTIEHVLASEIKEVNLNFPTPKEQTKIAEFLSAVDDKISQLSRQLELLNQYKKGVMQKIFSQEIRFKNDNGEDFGEWEEVKFSDIFIEIKDKVGNKNIETYSITAGKGFVSQSEKFGRDISGRQNENYIVLDDNDFSYNKGNSKTYKFGCVYLNNTGQLIAVPNVFISFRAKKNNIAHNFYAKLFEYHYLDKYLRQLISSSARMDGLLNISKEGFFEIPLPFPSKPEQEKIAEFLAAIDERIDHTTAQLTHTKQWKKGLLQQMFV